MREANTLPQASPEAKNEWKYVSAPPYASIERMSSTSLSYANGFHGLTLRLLMSYIYGAPSKARNANVVYIWTYVWQR